MRSEIKQLQRQNDERWVRVTEVNMSQHYVVASGIHSEVMQIQFDMNPPLVTIPRIGEIWLVSRRRQSWYLEKRQERGTEDIGLTEMNPGDKRIEAETLHLSGDVKINRQAVITIPSEPQVGDTLVYDGTDWRPVAADSNIPVANLVAGTEGQILTIVNGVPTWV